MSFINKLLAEKNWRVWHELVAAEGARLRLGDEDRYVAFPSSAECTSGFWLSVDSKEPAPPFSIHQVRTEWMIWCPRGKAELGITDERGRPVRRVLRMGPMMHGVQVYHFDNEDDALTFAAMMNLGLDAIKRSNEGGKLQ